MIGIVGGLGPYGGLDITKKIIDETAARSDQEHLPLLLFSCPNLIPDRTAHLLDKSNVNPGKAIAAILRQLDLLLRGWLGAAWFTLASTLPLFASGFFLLVAALPLLLLPKWNKIFLCGGLLHVHNGGAHVLLSAKARVRTNKHTRGHPNGASEAVDFAKQVNNAIYDEDYGIKAQPVPIANKAREDLLLVMDDLKKKGAQVIILGCAELPLAIPERDHNGMILIDPNRILARALVHSFAPDKLKAL